MLLRIHSQHYMLCNVCVCVCVCVCVHALCVYRRVCACVHLINGLAVGYLPRLKEIQELLFVPVIPAIYKLVL